MRKVWRKTSVYGVWFRLFSRLGQISGKTEYMGLTRF